jgi:N6-adenosine-specific RNA methylase IME4
MRIDPPVKPGEAARARLHLKQVIRAHKEAELAQQVRALPDKKYGVILADPPWRFEPYSCITGMDRAAENHYATAATEEIIALDVPSIAFKHSVLFLWATNPLLEDALAVMRAWGFKYKSNYVWVKDKNGTGYWSRARHELLLIGTRGSIPAPALGTQWNSVIEAACREHSRKPEAVREMIEHYYPNIPKIELHCRGEPRPGWDAWGAEAEMQQ